MASPLVRSVHEHLETPSWAPWLSFSLEEMRAYDEVFPAGQIVHLGDGDLPAGALTSIRMDWTGDPDDLGSWDAVSGKDTSVADSHRPDGNTLVLLSVSIRVDGRGRGLSASLVSSARELARSEGVDHVISAFRPSGFGSHKAAGGSMDFPTYCATRREDGLPVDPWLRALTRLGMRPLRVQERAMVVAVHLDELDRFRAEHRPEVWFRLDPGRGGEVIASLPADLVADSDEVWECGETGSWLIDRRAGRAVYVEANLWGELPFDGQGR